MGAVLLRFALVLGLIFPSVVAAAVVVVVVVVVAAAAVFVEYG